VGAPEIPVLNIGWVDREGAFVFMLQDATRTQTRAARGTVKLVAVKNVMPAFAAFYGAVNELKHRVIFLSRGLKRSVKTVPIFVNTTSRAQAMKKSTRIQSGASGICEGKTHTRKPAMRGITCFS
jgi:hypothetical protein